MRYVEIFNEIACEYEAARLKFPEFHSHHEAYAVIKEEFEEWWDSVKKNDPDRDELIQVMAMCLATLVELESPSTNLGVLDSEPDLDMGTDWQEC